MNEEAIKHAFDLFVRDGYNGDINKFQKLLATNPRALEYSFKLFEKDGYKDGPEKYKLLMGLNQVPYAPQKSSIQSETATTTTEPAKTEPAKIEPTTTVATETAPAKTEVVAETKVTAEPMAKAEPQITVKEVEAPVKEEPKKELPVSTGLTPITEKTEVKAVETPSDKMVIKSEKKEEVIPSYKNIDKNIDIAGGIFIDKSNVSDKLDAKELSTKEILEKDLLGKNWYTIELNRNVSSRYPDPPNVNTKNLKSYNQDEDFNVFKPIDIEGKKFYSNYDKKNNKWYIYEEGSNKDNWTEVKAGPIKSMLSSKYLKDGQPIKESRDYSESDYNEIESAKKKLSYSKYLQYLVSNVSNLSSEEKSKVKEILESGDSDKYYRWILYNVEDPKIADFWVNALEKFDIKSSYLDDIKKRRDELTGKNNK